MPPTDSGHLTDDDIVKLGGLFEKHGTSIANAIADRHKSELADAISAMTAQIDKAIQSANENTNDALSKIARHTDDALLGITRQTESSMQKMAGAIASGSSRKLSEWAAIVGVPLVVMGAGLTLLQNNLNTTLATYQGAQEESLAAYRETQEEKLTAYKEVQEGKIRAMTLRIDAFEERVVGLQEASDRTFETLTSNIATLSNSILAIGFQMQTGSSGEKVIDYEVLSPPEQ